MSKHAQQQKSRTLLHLYKFYLTADEVAYILQNSESELLIVSSAKLDIAKEAISQCPLIKEILVISDSLNRFLINLELSRSN